MPLLELQQREGTGNWQLVTSVPIRGTVTERRAGRALARWLSSYLEAVSDGEGLQDGDQFRVVLDGRGVD